MAVYPCGHAAIFVSKNISGADSINKSAFLGLYPVFANRLFPQDGVLKLPFRQLKLVGKWGEGGKQISIESALNKKQLFLYFRVKRAINRLVKM